MLSSATQTARKRRVLSCSGLLQQAKDMVNEILRERDHAGFGERSEYGSRMGGGGGIEVSFGHRSRDLMILRSCEVLIRPPVILQIPVPRQSVGVVIGRNGEMIKKIQNDAGVKIQFKPGKVLLQKGSVVAGCSSLHSDTALS